MPRLILSAAAILVLTPACFSQAAPSNDQAAVEARLKAQIQMQVEKPNAMCPVGLAAQRQGGEPVMWTIALEDAGRTVDRRRPDNVGVHVRLTGRDKTIRQVEFSVAYVPYGTHYMPVEGADVSELRKTFDMSAGDAAKLHLAGDLLVGKASGVTRVYLTSVTYGDGSEWHHAEGAPECSVAPNGYLLVGEAR